MDTANATISDGTQYGVPIDICTYKPNDNLNTFSAKTSDAFQYEEATDFCTYTSFDNQDNSCATECDPIQMRLSRLSDILQCDGADSLSGESSNHSFSMSEDEANSDPIRAVLVPSSTQGSPGAPLRLEVDTTGKAQTPSCVPLCAVTKPRSGWNKINNIRTFLRQIGPDILILSEHWGRKKQFENTLMSQYYKVIESSRGVRGIPTKGRNGNKTMAVTGGGGDGYSLQ